jgi:ankyrin repeat protein
MQSSRLAALAWCALLLAAPAVRAAESPLADAAEAQETTAVKSLLGSKADVNAAQVDGMTALHWAAWHDDAPLARQLVAAGADVKAANRYGVTPLALACTNGNGEVVELLLAEGADANAALAGGETALMTAARTGRLGPVKALLAKDADVNARERKGQTALMWAAAEGHTEVVDALLAAGADFRVALRSGFTALLFAAREGRSETALRLVAAGADVNASLRPSRGSAKPTSPLLLAVENGHFELALALVKAGANPNDQPGGYAALHAIAWVRKPIRGDGDPTPRGSGQLDSLEFVRQFVAQGADLNIRLAKGESARGRFTTTGCTPLLLAARADDVPLMRVLLDLGADPRLTNADDCPPLLAATGVGALGDGDEAAGTDNEALAAVKFLLDQGADVNAVDKNGETALHGAAYQSRANLVPLLVERGADIKVWNRPNKASWTPLDIAHGHRPGNFRPAPETIAAIERVMRDHGIVPPPPRPRDVRKWNED